MLSSITHASAATPYDVMWSSYGRLLDPANTNAWPDKVRAIARDEYHFWRGTRDVFYAWCRVHCADWAADPRGVVVSHGDLHWGNTGVYAARPPGTLAYGVVDFDESARLPFQLELLQGVVTFDFIARANGVDLSPEDREALRDAVLDTYVESLRHRPTDAGLANFIQDRCHRKYARELEKFTKDDAFRETVTSDGKTTDLLHSLKAERREGLAAALAEASTRDSRMAELLRPRTAAEFEAAIVDVVDRTRFDSSGSQGLSKILVLLRRPFRDSDDDGLLYLKQQLPSAAERASFVAPVPGDPAERYVNDLNTLTGGRAVMASWCDWAGRSYWVSLKEPWSDEPDYKELRTVDALLSAAKAWARVAAGSHPDADAARLLPLCTPQMRQQALDRSAECLIDQRAEYERFIGDPRVQAVVRERQ